MSPYSLETLNSVSHIIKLSHHFFISNFSKLFLPRIPYYQFSVYLYTAEIHVGPQNIIWIVLRINFVVFMFFLFNNVYVLKCITPYKAI